MRNIFQKAKMKRLEGQMKKWIKMAKKEEIDQLLMVLNDRYSELYLDWDIAYTALPKKDATQRKRTLANAFQMMDYFEEYEQIHKD